MRRPAASRSAHPSVGHQRPRRAVANLEAFIDGATERCLRLIDEPERRPEADADGRYAWTLLLEGGGQAWILMPALWTSPRRRISSSASGGGGKFSRKPPQGSDSFTSSALLSPAMTNVWRISQAPTTVQRIMATSPRSLPPGLAPRQGQGEQSHRGLQQGPAADRLRCGAEPPAVRQPAQRLTRGDRHLARACRGRPSTCESPRTPVPASAGPDGRDERTGN